MAPTLKITVAGKVQGVYFRDSTKKRAEEIGIKGYVRNLPDGRVECIAQGTDEQLGRFISFCKVGPRAALIESVDMEELESDPFDTFSVRW